MIEHSFKEAFRLIGRSKPECAAYLAILCLGEVLMFALSRGFGVDYPLGHGKPDLPRVAYTAAFSIPGYVLSTWAGAGLMGRISMDALTGAPGAMAGYANGWFMRYLKGTLAVVVAAFLPILLLLLVPTPLAIVIMAVWFLAVIWLAVRISMWGSIMFMDGLGPFAAMERSFTVSEGHAIPVAILSLSLPVAMLLGAGAGRLVSSAAISSALIKPLFLGAATLVQMGALATAYVALKKSVNDSESATPDSVPGTDGTRG